MTYDELDRIATFQDLVAMRGVTIQVDGINVRAVIERGQSSQSASEYGIDNRDDEVTATLLTTGLKPIRYGSPAVFMGRKMKVSGIEPIGEELTSITLENQ